MCGVRRRRGAPASGEPAATIEFGLSQNERVVRMQLPGLEGAALSDLLPVVGKYFAVARFDFHWSDEFAFTALDAPTGGEKEQDRLRVRFVPPRVLARVGTVEFKKDTDLTERDIQCIVEVWKALAADEPERDPADVLEELGALALDVAPPAPPERAATSADEDALLTHLDYDGIDIDRLIERCGLTPDRVSSMLLRLELRGLVIAGPGGTYQRAAGV